MREKGLTDTDTTIATVLSSLTRMTGIRGNSDPYFLAYLTSAPSVTAIVTSVAAAAATAIVSTVTTTSGVMVAVACIATTSVRFMFLDRHVDFLVDFLDLIFGLINLAVATNLQAEIVPKQSGVTVLKFVTLAYFHFFDTIVPKRDRDYGLIVAYDSILYLVRFAVTSRDDFSDFSLPDHLEGNRDALHSWS